MPPTFFFWVKGWRFDEENMGKLDNQLSLLKLVVWHEFNFRRAGGGEGCFGGR